MTFLTGCAPATLPGHMSLSEAARGHFVSFPFVHSSCPSPHLLPASAGLVFCHRSLGKSQGTLDAEGGARGGKEGRRGGCGVPRGTAAGLGTHRRLWAELGAHLQVPVHNVFLVTVVHSRYDLEGRGEEGRLAAGGPQSSQPPSVETP